MGLLKGVLIALAVYAGVVVVFETLIGTLQPAGTGMMVIGTTGADGTPRERVVQRLESQGQLYVASNHWVRGWYREALARPEVTVTFEDSTASYQSIPVTDREEIARLWRDHPLGVARVLMGFAPRRFVRLEPR